MEKMTASGLTEVSRTSTGKIPASPTTTSAIIPGPNPGERLATYFEKLFTAVIGISTLGASISFARMVSTPVVPWIDYGYGIIMIQTFLAIAWLLFVITLILTSLFASLLSLYRPQAVEAFATKNHHNKKRTMWAATAVSLLLIGLVFTSFIFLSLVVTAYTGPVGYAALTLTGIFGLIAIGGIIWQSPLDWPNWVYKMLPRTGKDEEYIHRPDYHGNLGNKTHISTWPMPRRNTIRDQLHPSNQPGNTLGTNLTGGTLLSSLKPKRSYNELLPESNPVMVKPDPRRMEESFTSEKEWENLRSMGAQPMRVKPRVSWPRGNVVSGQFSPPQPAGTMPTQPISTGEAIPRPPREWRHDRRARLQAQAQTQPAVPLTEPRRDLPPPREQPEYQQRDMTPSPPLTPPRIRYSGLSETTLSEDAYDEEADALSSVHQDYAYQQEEHHPPLHHHNQQQVHRLSGEQRPVYDNERELESGYRGRSREQDSLASSEVGSEIEYGQSGTGRYGYSRR